MSAPTIIWSETNGGATTDGIPPQLRFANIDAPSSQSGLSANHQVPAGQNSFEKWLRLKLKTAAPNTLSGFQVYFSADTPLDSASATNITVKFGVNKPYAAPTNAASTAATVDSATARGIANAVAYSGPANTPGVYGAYLVLQAIVATAAAQGAALLPNAFLNAAYSWS